MQEEEHIAAGDVHQAHEGEGSRDAQDTTIKEKPKWIYSLLEDEIP